MQKKFRNILLIFFVLIGILISTIICDQTIRVERINYSILIDEQSSETFPAKGNYIVSVSCENSKTTWDYDNWKLSISENTNISDDCKIEFQTIVNPNYLNNFITNSVNSTQGSSSSAGKIVNENGYRYEGTNPYNYVLFNNELWRIIGVFETTLSDGSTKQNLTKIIRNESIGSYVFNNAGASYWINTSGTKSNLNILLNDYYYYREDGTNSGSCYFYSSITRTCDYSRVGLMQTYRNMVENITWNLGGYNKFSSTNANDMYTYERSTTVPTANASTSTGYIGLMYPSDYGYSVLSSSCARTTSLASYNTASCAGRAWLLQNNEEWTISPNSYNTGYVWYIYNGDISPSASSASRLIRPVLYLKSGVYILDGDGSISNPYILSI